MKKAFAFFVLVLIVVLGFIGAAYYMPGNVEEIKGGAISDVGTAAAQGSDGKGVESQKPVITPSPVVIEPGKPLANPPSEVKAIYATGWTAGSSLRVDYLKKVIAETDANAVVIDLKDYAGAISYKTGDARISMYGGEENRISDIRKLVADLHANNIYVIGRITTFQDPVLAQKRPDIAVKDSKGNLWGDNKKLYWIDPSAKDAWDYNINLAKNAFNVGFDEINFDYVRFPSDGNLGATVYPVTDLKTTTKSAAVKSFFKYVRESLPGKTISADLFGLVTVNKDDMGIGQILENAFPYFDYIAPMVYPSHYASGFDGYKNPADYPYEVVNYSLASAEKRLAAAKAKDPSINAKIRPWLQDFSLGAVYDAEKVKAQITASKDAGSVGWMLWSPKNIYTKEAILSQNINTKTTQGE